MRDSDFLLRRLAGGDLSLDGLYVLAQVNVVRLQLLEETEAAELQIPHAGDDIGNLALLMKLNLLIINWQTECLTSVIEKYAQGAKP